MEIIAKTPASGKGTNGDRPPSDKPISVRTVAVGPARVECYGIHGPWECTVVDGEHFFEEIDGFEHEPGYEYRLRIERYNLWGGREPPQDAPSHGYRLLEVISKTPASGTIEEARVAPAKVQCPLFDTVTVCLLIDGRPFAGSIDGFEYEPSYEYRIRFESFAAGARRLLEIVEKPSAPGTVEEITVGPWRVRCYVDAPITANCIVVNGEPFYGTIEEFRRSHGYEYRLWGKYDLLPGMEFPPPETAKYGYRLLEVLSETEATEPPQTRYLASLRSASSGRVFQGGKTVAVAVGKSLNGRFVNPPS